MQAVEYLKDPVVQRLLDWNASKLYRKFPRTLDQDDARQEIIVMMLRKLKVYDSSRSSIYTFSSMVMHNFCSTWAEKRNTLKWVELQVHPDFLDEIVDPMSIRFEEHSVVKASLDAVDASLAECRNPLARPVFKLLRKGFRRVDCANELGISKYHVSMLIRRYIKAPVNKLCSG
jgi:DNA-directed RNA polymerase specialized sigma24 family protein